MSQIVTGTDCNLYQSAVDVLTVSILAICAIKGITFLEADAEIIAETLLDATDLTDVHALAKARSPVLLENLLRQCNACLVELSTNGAIGGRHLSEALLRAAAKRCQKKRRQCEVQSTRSV